MIKWIWLSSIPYIGPVTANKLLEKFKNPEAVYEASYEELRTVTGITKSQIEYILQSRSLERANYILEKCNKKGIEILTKADLRYPTKAKVGYDEPVILYCIGEAREIGKSVAVVGPRRCTQEEKNSIVNLTSQLVGEQYIIVSGMAKGVDSYAHTVCLKKGGYTIAVLGCGLDHCYPREHEALMREIMEKGLLISEYPPETKPAKYNFPKRNRIIAAWSDSVYVIGNRRISGANITATLATEYGRSVNLC